MDNGTMEVATSLGAVAGGAVVGAIAGRRVGRMIIRPPRARNRSLSEALDIATQTDAKRSTR